MANTNILLVLFNYVCTTYRAKLDDVAGPHHDCQFPGHLSVLVESVHTVGTHHKSLCKKYMNYKNSDVMVNRHCLQIGSFTC